jgi:putative radical SAM enzyme (TIGR03279 family)
MCQAPRLEAVSAPVISEVVQGSPAWKAGLEVGDVLLSVNGVVPLDVIEYQRLTDSDLLELLVRRPGAILERKLKIDKETGEPLGLRVDSAVFDRIRTCDNHCEFCFIYQLPKGLRKSLYLKDDDYRLSFLYGNFTTLTRFTELDAERVITEHLSPLYVSIHTTDPALRAEMLRNPRGATSLKWLDLLLEAGIEIHGQIVVCPGVNDGVHLERTLLDLLDRYADLASVAVVPLGVSDHSNEPRMRPHSRQEAQAVVELVDRLGSVSRTFLDRRMLFAADEYYLLAGSPIPGAEHYEGFTQIENGIGMVRLFEEELLGGEELAPLDTSGFFQSVDGAPPWGYRAQRSAESSLRRGDRPTLLSGPYGAPLLRSLLKRFGRSDLEVVEVENRFFGGNTSVAGLMTGSDLTIAIEAHGAQGRYLIPDVCLNEGRFLDGITVGDLPGWVEVVETSGLALRSLLEAVELPVEAL